MNLLAALFRSAPAPTKVVTARRQHTERPTSGNASRIIQIRLEAAQLLLVGSSLREVQAEGPISVERTLGGALITELAHSDGPWPICRLGIPEGATVDLELGTGRLTVHQFRGTLRARVTNGDVSVDESEGRFRVVVRDGNVAFERVNGEIDILTSGGTVTARRTQGGLQAVSNSGDLEFEAIGGFIAARTIDGSIDALDLHGTARLSTRTGTVRVAGECGQLTVRTQSGDIELDCSIVAHTLLETVKGNVDLKLGPLTNAHLVARVGRGVVRAERISPLRGSNRRTLRGTLGRGESRLQLSSRVGVINVAGPPRVARTPQATVGG
jgi:hypothetical protein